jgi:AraC family transcriptional regulator
VSATGDFITCTLKRQSTAVVRGAMPAADLPGWLPGVYLAVADYLERADVAAAGPPFARLEFRATDVGVEAGFPVSEPITGDGWVRPSTLPAGLAAVANHRGRREAIGSTCAKILGWLDRQGLAADGALWEVYLTDPADEPDPAHWRTRVVVPCRPRPAQLAAQSRTNDGHREREERAERAPQSRTNDGHREREERAERAPQSRTKADRVANEGSAR